MGKHWGMNIHLIDWSFIHRVCEPFTIAREGAVKAVVTLSDWAETVGPSECWKLPQDVPLTDQLWLKESFLEG